jgi:hypothetical protein
VGGQFPRKTRMEKTNMQRQRPTSDVPNVRTPCAQPAPLASFAPALRWPDGRGSVVGRSPVALPLIRFILSKSPCKALHRNFANPGVRCRPISLSHSQNHFKIPIKTHFFRLQNRRAAFRCTRATPTHEFFAPKLISRINYAPAMRSWTPI